MHLIAHEDVIVLQAGSIPAAGERCTKRRPNNDRGADDRRSRPAAVDRDEGNRRANVPAGTK